MKLITIQLYFSDSTIENEKLIVYSSDFSTGKINKNDPYKVTLDGKLYLPETLIGSILKYPYPLNVFYGDKQIASILILNKEQLNRSLQESDNTLSEYNTLFFKIDTKTGIINSGFLSETLPLTNDSISSNTNIMTENTSATSIVAPSVKLTKFKAKIADLQARITPKNVQVVIFGQKQNGDTNHPLALASSDANGNLIFDYPVGQFRVAYAIAATSPNEKIEINLKEDGTFPEFALLIQTELEKFENQEEHDDCACKNNSSNFIPRLPDNEDLIANDNYTQDIGGSCTNFTTPNRALEEFSYFRIIRTTDPSIITPEDTIALQNLDETIKRIQKDIFSLEKEAYPVMYDTGMTTPPKSSTSNNKIIAAQNALASAKQLLAEKKTERTRILNNLGTRKELSVNNMLDWDDTPTTYQNTSIAHGHLIEFRQVWKADGYSMGDLLYSLPLAPGQKRQIAVYDWDRYDEAQRTEDQTQSESLSNEQSRDRDINEIVSSVLNESQEADSQVKGKTTSWGVGVSVSTPTPVSVGVSGSFSMSNTNMNSSASQSSSRDLAGSSLQQIKDKTMQKASAIRSSRSTVIQAVNQGEHLSARTEVVANYNHCHAMTVQYFEVLRHFAVHNEIADVKECLFIPLPITPFDDAKVIRWEDILKRAIPNRSMIKSFDAVRRFYRFNTENNQDAYASFPNTRYCDERLKTINVKFKLDVFINRPEEIYPTNTPSYSSFITSINAGIGIFSGATELKNAFEEERAKHLINNQDDINNWSAKLGFIPGWAEIRRRVLSVAVEVRDNVFQQEMTAVDWLSFYIKNITISCFFPSINNLRYPLTPTAGQLKIFSRTNNGLKRAKMSNGKLGEEVIVGLTNINLAVATLTRALFNQVEIFYGNINAPQMLPAGSFVRLNSGTMDYASQNFKGNLFVNFTDTANLAAGERITIDTPLNNQELVNPRTEDIKLRNELLQHLNGNLEAYHHWIFYMMSPDRRYMLLDGLQIKVPGRKIPGTGNYYPDEMRSVASVVENRVIGVVGNNIIMPVAPGYNLDPKFRFDDDAIVLEDGTTISALMNHYMPKRGFKTVPFRISVPTKGVFAEAVMGACNSCERIDDTRYWKWEEHPIPDDPTTISALNTDSRYESSGSLSAKDFADALISLKDPQALPDPTGLSTALNNIVKNDSFRDITGLGQLQELAKQGILTTGDAAKHYATAANQMATLASNQKNSDSIQKAINNSKLPKEVKEQLMEEHLRNMINGKGAAEDKEEEEEVEDDNEDPTDEEEEEEDTPAPGEPVNDLSEDIDLSNPDFVAARTDIDSALNDMASDLDQIMSPFKVDNSDSESQIV